MTRQTPATLLPFLQWSAATVAFETGLVQSGLGGEAGSTWGLVQALAAVATVVPSLTGFLPRLAPLASAGLAVAYAAGAAGIGPAATSNPAVTALLAVGCALVAAGRAFLRPVQPLVLGPEARDPWRVPQALLERRRQAEARRRERPAFLAAA
jgi:hypothetical protein